MTFFGTDGKLAVYSLTGPHVSQADRSLLIRGWRHMQGLIFLCKTGTERLKLLQGERKRHLLNVFPVPETTERVLWKRLYLVLTVIP